MTLELDADGYPTEESLKQISVWPYEDFHGLMEAIKDIWAYPNYFTVSKAVDFHKPVKRFHVSTAGWSGNESIIAALKANTLFWSICWVQSRRGGHYIFDITEPTSNHNELPGHDHGENQGTA